MAHLYNKLSDEEIQIIIMDSVMPNIDSPQEMADIGEHCITEMEVIDRIHLHCKDIAEHLNEPNYSDVDLYKMLMPADRRILTNINRLISVAYLAVSWNVNAQRYSTLMLNDSLIPMVENHKLTPLKLIRPDDSMKILMKLHDVRVFK